MIQDKPPDSADRISIRELRFSCIVGIRNWERNHKQPISADIELEMDLRSAGESDDIDETVDYSRLCALIIREAQQSRYFLLEALAQRIVGLCLAQPGVKKVAVAIWKRRRHRIYRKASVTLVRQK